MEQKEKIKVYIPRKELIQQIQQQPAADYDDQQGNHCGLIAECG